MIETVKNALTQEECQEMLDFTHNLHVTTLTDARMYRNGGVINNFQREGHGIVDKVEQVIKDAALKYQMKYGIEPVSMEFMQFVCYPKGQGFFDTHVDGLDRKISAILYLNDVEEGGGTSFWGDLNYNVKPRAGKLIVFNPNLNHKMNVPLSEDENQIITWFR